MAQFVKPSFTGGELTPDMHGRVDLPKYHLGLATCRNFFIQAHGGASNRPGTLHVGPIADQSKRGRLLPFKFNTSDTYALEFGDQSMRVIRNGGHVLEPAKAIGGAAGNPVQLTVTAHGWSTGDEIHVGGVAGMTELNGRRFKITVTGTDTVTLDGIDGSGYGTYSGSGTAARVYTLATPYLEADLPLLKFTQSADVMTLTHPAYQTRELSRTDHDAWSLDVIVWTPEVDYPTGIACAEKSGGSEVYRYRVTAVKQETLEESLPGLGTSKAISGALPQNPVRITATAHGFADNDEVYISGIVGMTELNGRRFTINYVDANTFDLVDEDGTGHTAYASGGTAEQTFGTTTSLTLSSASYIDIAWTAPGGDIEKYNVYREKNGLYGFIGSVDATADLTFRDDNIAPDLDDTPPKARDPFDGANKYPGCTGYYDQRRTFGRSYEKPDTFWLTQTGKQKNMNVSTPSKDDDAITATLNSDQVNAIRHMVALKDLLIFTAGSEWKVNSGADAGLSPSSIEARPQSYIGSSDVPPIKVKNSVLFLEGGEEDGAGFSGGIRVHDVAYALESDGYAGRDLSVLSEHLFEGRAVTEWGYAKKPYGIAWCIRDDGVLLGLTYLREHEVWAWHRHDTAGAFESVCVIAEGNEDAVYVIVKRTIAGQTVRNVERFHTRLFDDVRDCFFVDNGLSYDAPVAITGATKADPVVITAAAHGFANGDEVDIFDAAGMTDLNANRYTVANVTTDTFELSGVDGTGFGAYVSGGTARKAVQSVGGAWHLEGMTVTALCDGDVVDTVTIANGTAGFDRKYSRIHLGQPYTAELETLDIDDNEGRTQGKKKRVAQVACKYRRTRGLKIGPNGDKLTEMKQRQFENYGEPTRLLTGMHRMNLKPDWNSNGRILLRQDHPLPATVLSISPEFEIGS